MKAPDLLCEEIVNPLEQRLGHHRLHQMCVFMLNHFSRVQLCGPMNCSLPDSSVHGILQARILEWVAAEVQPRLIQGIRSGDGVGEDQDTIASIRY